MQVRCPTSGYLRTLPFERSCPMPGAFVADSAWLDGLLKPVIKPKGAVAAAPTSGKAPEAVGARAAASKAAKAEKAAAKTADAAPAPVAVPAVVEGAAPAAPSAAEVADTFSKARLAVGRVLSAAPVEGSDKLYLCQVEVGEEKPRQVITGLQKFGAQEVLCGASVVVILNLKTAKLAGHVSEAMILAAEEVSAEAEGGRYVRLLSAPAGAAPGERVHGALLPAAAPPKECKSAPWALVKSLLRVQGGRACFAGEPLRTASGEVSAPGSPDGSPIG